MLVLTLCKRCHVCGAVKPVSEFYVDRHRSDGYTSKCRVCSIAYAKAYYARNRERVLARQNARNRARRQQGDARRVSG